MKSLGLNFLILSCGTRNKIVQYFKQELRGRGSVVATDCSRLAPALYEADRHYIVPRIDSTDYLDVVLDICDREQIRAVISLIDPELSLLAKNRKAFEELGVTPVVCDQEVVETCFDKYQMYRFLTRNGFPTPRSYIDKEAFYEDLEAGRIEFPVFVKPIKGSASININKVTSKSEIEFLFERHDDLMIQEFMNGTEIGADMYIDMISGEPVAIFAKEKLKMRAGETDKAVSMKDKRLFDLLSLFVRTLGLQGITDIDIFRVNGDYYISEVNPRFGGGYPHAHECRVNAISLLINNLNGYANIPNIGDYDSDVYMMKFSEVVVFPK